jgi:hypothetical protein
MGAGVSTELQRRAKVTGVTPIGIIGTDSLNEDAAHFFAGQSLISRRPSSPTFWFYSLALESKTWTWGPKLHALLSDESLALLDRVDLSEYTQWCTCCDDSLRYGADRGSDVICWPCLFDAHHLCSLDCSSSGEIHFPEKVMQMRQAA